jgi:hypothetical protein
VLGRSGDQFIPMMETRTAEKGEGEIPTDVQLKVRFKDMPKSYYGLQAQVNINDVQGRSYPYFYCVLVAEKRVNLWPFWEEVQEMRKSARPKERKALFFGLIKLERPSERIVVEHQKQREVEVLVIRQRTTKTSGYHVSGEMALEIFRTAYGLGRKINLSLLE